MFKNTNNSTHKTLVHRAAYLLVAAVVAASVAAPVLAAPQSGNAPRSRPRARPADINKDGTVNVSDMAILLSDYSGPANCRSFMCRSDLNGDGHVDGVDLGILLADFG